MRSLILSFRVNAWFPSFSHLAPLPVPRALTFFAFCNRARTLRIRSKPTPGQSACRCASAVERSGVKRSKMVSRRRNGLAHQGRGLHLEWPGHLLGHATRSVQWPWRRVRGWLVEPLTVSGSIGLANSLAPDSKSQWSAARGSYLKEQEKESFEDSTKKSCGLS